VLDLRTRHAFSQRWRFTHLGTILDFFLLRRVKAFISPTPLPSYTFCPSSHKTTTPPLILQRYLFCRRGCRNADLLQDLDYAPSVFVFSHPENSCFLELPRHRCRSVRLTIPLLVILSKQLSRFRHFTTLLRFLQSPTTWIPGRIDLL